MNARTAQLKVVLNQLRVLASASWTNCDFNTWLVCAGEIDRILAELA